jgi:RimJ/RimL family protein N-acetyltransferase
MQIIEGRDVDLVSPFPAKEYHRIFNWLHCYRTIVQTPNFPKTPEELAERFAGMKTLQTFGIIDKNNILGIRHEVPLIGLYTFDQDTIVNGNAHVASTRKAWGSRLVDQAGQVLLNHIFFHAPTINRVSVTVLSSNAPAKALAKRLGFSYEGCLRDAVVINEVPQNMALFGLTRRDWVTKELFNTPIEPIVPAKSKAETVGV